MTGWMGHCIDPRAWPFMVVLGARVNMAVWTHTHTRTHPVRDGGSEGILRFLVV